MKINACDFCLAEKSTLTISGWRTRFPRTGISLSICAEHKGWKGTEKEAMEILDKAENAYVKINAAHNITKKGA